MHGSFNPMSQHLPQSKTDKVPTSSIGMSAPPQITAIIPTFRRPKLLRRAIESVLCQTYPLLRVCVYDNASGDETAGVVADLMKKDHRVSYHCHSENIGALNNFNHGLKNVITPFFSFLSDDDILLPEFYETAMKGFADHPDAAFSAVNVIIMNADGAYVGCSNDKWEDGCYYPSRGLQAIFENNTRTPTWTGILYRSMVIEQIGLLDGETGTLADQDFTLRVAARFPFVLSKVPGAIFVNRSAVSAWYPEYAKEWLGWKRIIYKLNNDHHIPQDLKKVVNPYLSRELKAAVVRHGRSSLLFEKYDNAYRMASVLEEDGDARMLALVIRSMTVCCRYIPCFHRVLVFFNSLRRRVKSKIKPASFSQAERYAHYFKEM